MSTGPVEQGYLFCIAPEGRIRGVMSVVTKKSITSQYYNNMIPGNRSGCLTKQEILATSKFSIGSYLKNNYSTASTLCKYLRSIPLIPIQDYINYNKPAISIMSS